MHSRSNPEKIRLPFEPEGQEKELVERPTTSEKPRPDVAVKARPAGKTWKNSLGMELVLVPAGEFVMGMANRGEKAVAHAPEHYVRITRQFYLGKHEVTQGQYSKIMGSNPSWYQITGGGQHEIDRLDTSTLPVEMVSWEKATEFCRRLSEAAAELKDGCRYRLPTEAEWEYACRAGCREPFSPEVVPVEGVKPIVVTEVGAQAPNEFGLCDMSGNVWEWCTDWQAPDYYKQSPQDDPQGPKSGLLHVVRGRAWAYAANPYGYARDAAPASRRAPILGFRVVCER